MSKKKPSINEIKRRFAELESGKVKGLSLTEIEKTAKKNNKKRKHNSMNKCVLILLMCFTFLLSKGQTVERIIGTPGDYMFRPASIRNYQLFDSEEIKVKKIKSCIITKSSYNYYKPAYETDTLEIFAFDTTGNIYSNIHFREYSNEKDTFDYRSSTNQYYTSIDSSVSFGEGTKTVEKYYIWAFNWEKPEEIDTGIIVRRVYDGQNRLIEWKSNGTQDYHKIILCGTGITFHYKYGYDSKNRINFYDVADYRYTASYKYTMRGVAVSVNNKEKALEKQRKYFVKVKKNGNAIIENDGDWVAVLKFLSSKSKLFKELSCQQPGKGIMPTVYQLIYEYDSLPMGQNSSNSIVSN